MMHRWAAYLKFKDATGSVSSALLGQDSAHWSFLLDSAGSVMYGNVWQDNSNGTFTSTTPQGQMKSYSPLDLYLMGMIDKSKVPPMLLINSPATDSTQLPQAGVTVTGTAQYVTIDQIIAAMGPRIPDATTSQKSFKTAFIFATQPGTFTGKELYGIENIRSGQVTRFSILTNGQGIVEVASTPKDNIPTNPGVLIPSRTPRTLPPNINDGAQWLMTNQKTDGSWADLNQTVQRDTASATQVLQNFTSTQANYQSGLLWLEGTSSGNMDFLSRKIRTLAVSGADLTTLMNDLLSRQNPDGGWGSDGNYPSNPVDTALALKALSAAGYSTQQVVSQAIGYLKYVQNTDGGWGTQDSGWGTQDSGSTVRETSNVLSAFNKYRTSYQLEDPIMRGTALLSQRQNADGGFGNSPSTVYDTAAAALTLGELNVTTDITNKALSYLMSQQSGDGSWNESAYQTALAVNAIFKATVDPDLSVKPGDISIIPATIQTLPANIVINANIWNLGGTSIPQATVVLYDGTPAPGNKIGQQTLAFPGQASTTVAFSVAVNDGNEHAYTIVIDPDNLIKESNKLNNQAVKGLTPEATYDFVVLASDITVSTNPADLLQDVAVSAKITNKGTMNAYNVQVKYYIDDPVTPIEIATQTVDIPAGATITNSTTWRANKAGANLPLTVLVDPFNNFVELSKANNKAAAPITVNADNRANLTSSYKDIIMSPSPANQGGDASISALVKNEGSTSASNVLVNFYEGVPGVDGVLLGSQIVPIINPGDSIRSGITWTNIKASGEKILYVKVDPDNQISEISKDDNDAFTTVNILSLPDLVISTNSIVFSPGAPKEGDNVAVSVTVQDSGEQAASNVAVQFSEGGTILDTKTIPLIAGNSTSAVSTTYDTTGKTGAHEITVSVDPGNAVAEQNKNNNTASRSFGVQNANLWVTEPYISPSGDGIKDSTQFFFRFDVPRTVTISAVNVKGVSVRTFSGPELANISSGSITWDGLNDKGMVVPDGNYNLRLIDSTGPALGSVNVTVDNNQSPLYDAFGTKYLLNNSTTCGLQSLMDSNGQPGWKWFPDESGLLITTPYSAGTSAYPVGLYTISPDGGDILRIVPPSWTEEASQYCYLSNPPCVKYSYPIAEVSPNSQNVAFILDKWNSHFDPNWTGSLWWIFIGNQLWSVDRYGQNLVMMNDFSPTSSILDVKWSPRSDYLVYRVQQNGSSEELWTINADGTGKKMIDSGGYFDFNHLRWSPDGTRMAYVYGSFNASGGYSQTLRIVDASLNHQDVFSLNGGGAEYMEWLGSQKIVLNEDIYSYPDDAYELWIIDASGTGNNIHVYENPSISVEVAPDGHSFAFATNDWDWRGGDTATLNTFRSDADGNVVLLDAQKTNEHWCEANHGPIIWSPDSSKIAFSSGVGQVIEGGGICANLAGPFVNIVSMQTGTEVLYPVDMQPATWSSDGAYLIDLNLCILSVENGDYKCNAFGTPTYPIGFSPKGQYYNYDSDVDPSSVCARDGKYEDLWSLSSVLNLTVNLTVVKQSSAIILKGTASDLNFDVYQLDYADVRAPASWNTIAPPSSLPVVNGVFTAWVPPAEGSYYVRLTAQDKAGNSAVDVKRVNWGQAASITSLYKTPDIISPNGDGINDTVSLHYRVLEPVHLEFNIYDDSNSLVKTFTRDYTSPQDDTLLWDGRNESGSVVPDGNYSIRVFDFEFAVEVDNTPPDVNINQPGLSFDPTKPYLVYAEVSGRASDKNIKSWTVEQGDGDNPDTWYVDRTGNDTLADIPPLFDYGTPSADSICQYYSDNFYSNGEYPYWQFNFPRGAKFKMTAEDYAGNKSTSISSVLDDGLYLLLTGMKTKAPGCPHDELTDAGVHQLTRVTTVRRPMSSMILQELTDGIWSDALTLPIPDQTVDGLEWTNTLTKPGLSAIRLKGVDDLGNVYFSNVLNIVSNFGINISCVYPPSYYNYNTETFVSLKVQYQQQGESSWHDLWDSSNSSELLYYIDDFKFHTPPVPYETLPQGVTYNIRMQGIGKSGREYDSRSAVYPPNCPVTIKLEPEYGEADCGQLGPGTATLSAGPDFKSAPFEPLTLSYYMQTAQGEKLLRTLGQNELAIASWGSATVDTKGMQEGPYPVKAVLEYLDSSWTAREALTTNVLHVDRVLPTAQLTYPTGNSLRLCPVTMNSTQGNWFGIPVEAIIDDNTSVSRYELYYGIGDNPDTWLKADDFSKRTKDNPSGWITGTGSFKGRIGTWDITGMAEGTYSLKLVVVDVAGNKSCTTATFSIDTTLAISNMTTDAKVISPNNDGAFDSVTLNFEIDKSVVVDVKVFNVITPVNGNPTFGSAPIRTIKEGSQHLGGMDSVVWDGKNDGQAAAADGLYAIFVIATDSCGNSISSWAMVEVDNTPPALAITYPQSGSTHGNVIEVRGSATDQHFQNYILEVGQGSSPSFWMTLASKAAPVSNDVLGAWNTFGDIDVWTLRLTALDTAGNKNVTTLTIDLGIPQSLTKNFSAYPGVFSPNNDGKLDTVTVQYELSDACTITLDFLDASGATRKTYSTTTPILGPSSYVWDGRDAAGNIVPDGVYTVRLKASLVSNPAVTDTEIITVIVDTTAPLIDIKSPLDGSYISTDITVTGTVSDADMNQYSLTYSGSGSPVVLDNGNQNRSNYFFGSMNGLAEGNYTLSIQANDAGQNVAQKNISFTIDRTPPAVTLAAPKNGEYYGANQGTIAVNGSIVEKNPDTYTLRYGLGDAPTQWTAIASGATLTSNPSTFSWKVGKNDGVPDGSYILSLLAQDRAGLTGEAKVKITIDNTPPSADITSPVEGRYVKTAADIKGTAFDQNLDKYTIDISEGQCAGAFKWAPIRTATAVVQDGVLGTWQALPTDGDYCIRLSVVDKVGLTAEAKVDVKVDTHPPAAPALSGGADNGSNASLTWTANIEPDLAGYNLYRNDQKLNVSLITDIKYLDQGLLEGVYAYTVKAVDLAGWESKPSNSVSIKIDLTPPDAGITSPQNNSRVSGLIDIKGTAYSLDDFKQYRVSIGQGAAPATWTVIRTSPVPISYGTLVQWNTFGLNEGQVYSIKLEAEDLSGNVNTQQVIVTIDNTAPAKPVIVSAIASGSTATVTWNANTESDMAGYLVYRNDQLANANGLVVGNVKPYLVSGTTYSDSNLPDGVFTYYLVAVDQAGNTSDPSDSRQVTIDTRAPHAVITSPATMTQFEQKLYIKAESPDLDVAQVQLQYKKVQDSIWTNLGAPMTSQNFAAYLDPAGLGLSYGDYQIMAVATDQGMKTDPTPTSITVTYTDITPPAAPQGLLSRTTGSNIALTWTENSESDLAGYNVYRIAGASNIKINTALTGTSPEPQYQDIGLSDGTYGYQITAVDTYGNESKPSGSVSAIIYAPIIAQPYTPAAQPQILIQGTNASANSAVAAFDNSGSGPVSLGTATADANGVFMLNANLALGENRLFVHAIDSAGNVSRDADAVVVVYDTAPGIATGLTASVQGHDVSLAWNPNPEANVLGYNLIRNGQKLNAPDSFFASQPTFTASSVFDPYSNPPGMAMDASLATYWMPQGAPTIDNPEWWEMDLASPELISHIELHWGSDSDAAGNPVLYAGKDYEIQVWSGYAWITQVKTTGNAVKDNSFDFKPSYRTGRIRIVITDSTDVNSAKLVRLTEVGIRKDNLIVAPANVQPSYSDTNLLNNQYGYTLTAVDSYGFESLPTSTVSAVVSIAAPSTAPDLTASVLNSDVMLSWTASPEEITAGYDIYKNTTQGWSRIGTVLSAATSYVDANQPNGTYSYKVTAADAIGNEGPASNVAIATVSVTVLSAPVLTGVTPISSGRALGITWTYSGSAAGFNVYRGTTAGGPYAIENAAAISGNSYIDAGLAGGATYFYVVAAVDAAGNVSAYSNEGSGTPYSAAVPTKPVIYYPTVAGVPVNLSSDRIRVAGSADPGSVVELFQNGQSAGTAMALWLDDISSFGIEWDGDYAAASPDGTMLAFTSPDGLMLMTVPTGTATLVVPGANIPVWSYDSTKIAYNYWDEASNYRIGIYDITSGQAVPLTGDATTSQGGETWSADNTKMSFIIPSGIWLKDFASGLITQVVDTTSIGNQQLSPDNRKIAYFVNQYLYVYDFGTNATQLVDDNTDYYSAVWSPDGAKLAFISYRNGPGGVYIMNYATSVQTAVAGASGEIYYLSWTADGRSVLFDVWDYDNVRDTLWQADVTNQTAIRQIMPEISNNWYLSGTQVGQIVAIEQDAQGAYIAHILDPSGRFEVDSVVLSIGDNELTAVGSNTAGDGSPASDPVSVTYRPGPLPDLAVTAGDVHLYPPLPIAGQQMAVNAVVSNMGPVDAADVDVVIYAWNALGQMELLTSTNIPSIPAGSSTVVAANWDSTGKTGDNRIVVVVDPYDKIAESDETNNMAMKDIYVSDLVGVSMAAATDAVAYSGNQAINIDITLRNSGTPTNAVLQVRIEDVNGYPVTTFDSQALSLDYGQTVKNLAWNTGATLAGAYAVHAWLQDATGVLAETRAAFTVLADNAVNLAVTTDKASYNPQDKVTTNFVVTNTGLNSITASLQAQLSIVDPSGKVLYSDVKTASDLMPGSTVDFNDPWNAGYAMPGAYQAVVTVTADNGAQATKTAVFTINASVVLAGSVTASPSVVSSGNDEQVSYTLTNTGNADAAGYPVTVSVIDPDTQTVLLTHGDTLDIAGNSSKTGQFTVFTAGFGLKTYTVVLRPTAQNAAQNLGSASFAVKDLTPPVVDLISPAASSTFNNDVNISVLASDNASGVDSVEYQMDNGPWMLLPIADPSQGRYAATWTATAADNGTHTVSVRATDKAGNISIPVPAGFVIQINTAPSLATISGVPSSPTKETSATLVIGGADVVSYKYRLDSGVYSVEIPVANTIGLSGLTDGVHTVYVISNNSAGVWQPDASSTTASWTVDTQPPTLALSTLPDGAYTNNAVLNMAGTAGDANGIQSVMVSGQTVTTSTSDNISYTFSYPVSLGTGSNVVTTVATDEAGNTTIDTRTIILDLTAPVITITTPADNSVVSNPSLTVTGTTDKTATVLISLNSGPTVTVATDATAFSLPITLATDTNNTIFVYATDLSGNTSTAKRSVMDDDTNPALAITSPNQDMGTNQANVMITGTVSDLTEVSLLVTCPTASVGIVSTPTATTWSVDLTNMQQGTNTVTVAATDEAGNSTSVIRNIISSPTPVTIDPVKTPTNNGQQQITGAMELNSTITVSCATAMVGTISYPTTTTWQAIIAGMSEGANSISATATDLEGNTTDPVTATIVLDTHAPDTIITSGPGALTIINTASFSFTSTEDGSTFECKLDTTNYAACSGAMNYNNLIEGMHTFMVRATDPAGNTDPTPAVYTWKVDTIPPIAVIIDTPPSLTNARGASLAVAGDDVIAYKYHLDLGTMFSAETAVSTPIIVSGLLDGTHTIFVTGKDSAGNWQHEENATIAAWTVDITPPALNLSTLANGRYTNNPILNISGTTGDANGIQSVMVSGQTVTTSTSDNISYTFSYPVSLGTGSNVVTTVATDEAGNTTIDTRTIILDLTAPVITITTPADNSVVSNPSLTVTGTTDKTATVLISLNSGPTVTVATDATAFSLPITLATDTNNTIFVYATDLSGNTSTAKRSVMDDDTTPALAITSPNQDMGTNQTNVMITGTVSDLTEVSLLVTCPTASVGIVSTPTATTWSVDLTNMQQGTNTVTVAATDEAGNSTSVIRNIISSPTPVTIDPVKTPTNNGQQQITGAMELNSTITVSCATAMVGTISYPTTTTWQAIIAGMSEGANSISATATDLEGNTTDPVTATIVLDTHAPATTVSPAPGTYFNAVTATLAANEPATIYYTVDGTAPTALSAVYNGPLLLTSNTALEFFSVDLAMNTESVKSATYAVIRDTEPPVTTITAGTPNFTSSDGKLYVKSLSNFTLSATDDISGVATIGYRLDGGTWNAYASPLSLVTEGSHTIGYRSTDNAANVEIERSLGAVVDNTAPVSTITIGGSPVTVSTAITLSANDNASGVRMTEYSIDDGPWIAYNAAFTLSGYMEGQHSINYRSTDNLGNIETVKSILVQLVKMNTTLTYTGPTLIAQGRAVTLAGALKASGSIPTNPSGQIVTFTLDVGTSSQSCTGTTDTNGNATCTISTVAVPAGITTVLAVFSGDPSFQPASDSKQVTIFRYPATGAFVIGDRNAAVNSSVTFWGSQWSKNNSSSGGSAPSSFKGYAGSMTPGLPSCGGIWNANPGNSSNPPASVPAYMAVIVSSSINKSGSTITGNIVETVVIRTNPGYGPNPGHAGTGTIIGVLPCK